LQEHKTHSQVKKSPLKRCMEKSASQISTQLGGTQLNGDLSCIFAIRPQTITDHSLIVNFFTRLMLRCNIT